MADESARPAGAPVSDGAVAPMAEGPRHHAGLQRRVFRENFLMRAPWRAFVAGALALLGIASAVLIAATRQTLLPARFSYDARFIQRLAQGGETAHVDRSYLNTAGLYRVLGLQNLPSVVTILTVALFTVIVAIALLRRSEGRVSIPAVALAAVALMLGAVYLGTYSKDAPVLLVSAVVLLSRRRLWWDVPVIAVIGTYAWLFRSYWFLVLAVFIVIRIVQRFSGRWWIHVLSALATLVVIACGIAFVLHLPPDYFRTAVNMDRVGSADAKTMLEPVFAGPEPLAGMLNVLLAFLLVQLPIPLVLMGGVYYVGVALLISAIWGAFWWTVVSARRWRANAPEWTRAVAVVLAFLVVESFFEPDYGSALRHLTPMLPIVVFVVSARVRGRRVRREALRRRTGRVADVEDAAPARPVIPRTRPALVEPAGDEARNT